MATILVVDDNPINRDLIIAVLKPAGHRMLEAANGVEGLGLARVAKPDIVIADILMPKMDGYEFARELQVDPVTARATVIFWTASYYESEVRALAERSGVHLLMPKPADPEMIRKAVAEALEQTPHPSEPVSDEVFHREHLAVLNEKLLQQVHELEISNRERQKLLAHLVTAQEEERKRIASDIHDDSIQVMTAASIRLEMIGRKITDPSLQESMEQLEDTVRLCIERLRNLLFQLRPPALDREGLAAALEMYLAQAKTQAGYDYDLQNEITSEPPLETRVILFRIAQEALANVAKHAGASKVEILLQERDRGFHVQVADDGRGFLVEDRSAHMPTHLGLVSMRERAEQAGGWWQIQSVPGSGTTVEYWIPSAPAE